MLVILLICPPSEPNQRAPAKLVANLTWRFQPAIYHQLSLDWHPESNKARFGMQYISSARNCLELFDSSAKSADEGSQNVTKLWSKLGITCGLQVAPSTFLMSLIVRLSGLKSGCHKIHSPWIWFGTFMKLSEITDHAMETCGHSRCQCKHCIIYKYICILTQM